MSDSIGNDVNPVYIDENGVPKPTNKLAPLSSPTFTGTPTLSTPVDDATNNATLATTAWVRTRISNWWNAIKSTVADFNHTHGTIGSDGKVTMAETPAGDDPVNVDYLKQEISKSEGTRTPLIDWDYVESGLEPGQAKWVDDLPVTWKYSSTLHNQIYSDGRYALYIYPLKEDFTKYKEICFVFGDYSDGTPDIATKVVRSRDLDWAMSLPINSACTNLDSILIPGSQVMDYIPLICPYSGSHLHNHSIGSKSTKRKLVTLGQKWSAAILEIYGLN